MTPEPLRARLEQATPDAIVVEVTSDDGTRRLEFRSPDPVWTTPPPNLDFAAVALVQYAASEGRDLVLEGQVSTAQLDRLDEYLQIWSVWRPDLFQHVALRAEEEVDLPAPEGRGGAVMGFSGGVDAGFALAAHATRSLGRLSRPVDLGVLVVGWDIRHGDDDGLRRAREAAQRSLDAYGVELAVVSTNWQQDFCNAWFMSFNSGLMSILHTFSAEHSAAIHANDHNYRDEMRMPPYGSNMAINHLLGNPAFPVVSTGGTHRRIERVGFLADHPALLEGLRVCYQAEAGGSNCGHCEKCVRTQLELRVLGLSAEKAFPSPMTVEDLAHPKANNPTVLMHFEDILARMARDDELRGPVTAWVEALRKPKNPHVRRLEERVHRLEGELREAREEVAAMHESHSWKVTAPLRATTDRLRAVRQRTR